MPTKLVATNDASHVVAAFIFFNFGPANGTELDSSFFLGPSLKLVIDSLLAGLALVPVVAALETDLGLALRTLDHFVVERLAPDETLAARLGAPAH